MQEFVQEVRHFIFHVNYDLHFIKLLLFKKDNIDVNFNSQNVLINHRKRRQN